ncbi:hypothetical protein LTR50_002888 [Elasticomyces elasticus]|nr:hypothetical protein LTR50_002888 [Elasticomyces elasticus]
MNTFIAEDEMPYERSVSPSSKEHSTLDELAQSKELGGSDIVLEKADSKSSGLPPPNGLAIKNEKREKETEDDGEDGSAYPSGIRLVLIMASLCLTLFLFALDGTILATALPQITDQFNSLNDIAWYSAAFFLTTCAFQLPFGRAYSLLNTKWTYLVSVFIFLVGSAVCGATPTSIGLIIGRAIAGIGGAGVIGGVFIIISKSIPLRKRSLYTGFIGASLSISSVLGPIIGGALTTNVSWRWCFYINLPVGGAVLAFVFLSLPDIGRTSTEFKRMSWWQKFRKFNPVGTVILLGSISSLILALQWGGASGKWDEGRVIATLVVFAVTSIIWAGMQYVQGEDATVPWSVARQRSVAGATLYGLFGSAAFTIIICWLPLWFQTIKGNSAEESGIHNIPLTIGIIVFSLGAGGLTMLIGYYSVFLLLGALLMSLGAGLLMTLKTDSGLRLWLGYQVIFAAGVGMSLEQCNLVVQAVLPDKKIPAGVSLIIFTRTLAGSIGSAIGQNVYQDNLTKQLAGIIPTSDLFSGATNLVKSIQRYIGDDPVLFQEVLGRINYSLMRVFTVALILACLTFPASLMIEWKSVKKEKRKNEDAKEKVGRMTKEKQDVRENA